MIDYCLFLALFQNDILSYNILGEHFELLPKSKALIDFKNIVQKPEAELVIINQESAQFIDYYCKNLLSDRVKWLFVIPKDEKDARNIFNEIRGFGEPYFVQFPKPLIIIKNVLPNFMEYHRKDILLPISFIGNLDDFLNIEISENDISDVEYIVGEKEYQLIKSLSTNAKMLYFGHTICSRDLQKCKMFSKMKFHIIECVDINNNETKGYFVHSDYVEKAWLYHLTNFQSIKNLYKFRDFTIKVPVY